MKNICSIEYCTGCGLCAAVCPKGAIKIVIHGIHYFPRIDKNKCIDCGLCHKQCIVNHPVSNNQPLFTFAAWSKDEREHFECASGGLATVLSKYFIQKGGYVAGCAWNDRMKASTIITNDLEDIRKLMKSKYVHNYFPVEAYQQIKRILKNGQQLLFIGVPCQCAAIKRFCKSYDKNLYIISLLCRGGASPYVFDNYLSFFSSKYGKIKDVTFRGGENDCKFCVYGENNTIYYIGKQFKDPYFWSFMRHTLYRKSCFSCLFAKSSRPADLTLADFWGLDSVFIKQHHLDKGVNLVITHTEKGNYLLSQVKDKIECYERELDEAINGNETLHCATPKPQGYDMLNFIYPRIKNLKVCCWLFDFKYIQVQSFTFLMRIIKAILPIRVIKQLKKLS